MKRPQEKEYFKGWLTSADDAIDKGAAYAKALNEYIDNLEIKVNELNIASVDCQLCADCESNKVYKNGLCFECQDRHPEI